MITLDDLRSALLRIVSAGDDHTARQLALMLCLKDGPATVAVLHQRMGVAKPVITRAVDRLVEDQYAERSPDPNDRRSVIVTMLPAGRKFIDTMLKA